MIRAPEAHSFHNNQPSDPPTHNRKRYNQLRKAFERPNQTQPHQFLIAFLELAPMIGCAAIGFPIFQFGFANAMVIRNYDDLNTGHRRST